MKTHDHSKRAGNISKKITTPSCLHKLPYTGCDGYLLTSKNANFKVAFELS